MSNSSPSSRMSEPLCHPDREAFSPSNNNNNNNNTNATSSSANPPPAAATTRTQTPTHPHHHPRIAPLDHASRVYSGLAMALVIPVTITMLIIVWTLQSLGPVDNRNPASGPSSAAAPVSTSADPIFVVNKESNDKTTGEKIGGALLNMLIVVAAITVITFIMVILYKYGYAKVLYVWLGLSAAMIFFFLSALYIDMIAVRYQIPYDYVMLVIFVWNFGVVGILSVFYMGHPIMSQAYLIVVSVVTAWGLSQTPEWTTWALLVGVAIYDIVAVLCPKGPLKMLVEAAQERKEPIPGFVYDSDAGPGIELTEHGNGLAAAAGAGGENRNRDVPAPRPTQAISNSKSSNEPTHNNSKVDDDNDDDFMQSPSEPPSEPSTPSEIVSGDVSNPLDELLGVSNKNNNNSHHNKKHVPKPSSTSSSSYGATTNAAAAAASSSPAPKPAAKAAAAAKNNNSKKTNDDDEEEEETNPFKAAHHASAFKLGLGDFIFYSLLVGRAAMTFQGTQTPWLICYICIICGMGATLASLLFLRGKVPALPALPFSIFAATAAFFITRYLTLPYWDFLTLYAMMP